MRRTWALAALALLVAAGPATAAGTAAEQTVSFASGEDKGTGVLFTPEGKGPFPALIVIHEWWGLDDWVKQQARALSREGYVAFAVDLYHGKVTDKQEEAHQLMMGLPQDRAIRELQGAYRFLQARPDVSRESIGAIGWCMGGRYALLLATVEPRLAATVAYYGAPPTDSAAIAAIRAPVLGNYGAEDKGPAPEQVESFEAAMKKAGKMVDIKLYPGAGHAFANVDNPWGGYRKEAAEDAWARSTAFLDRHLKRK